jgi:hypothetical protein
MRQKEKRNNKKKKKKKSIQRYPVEFTDEQKFLRDTIERRKRFNSKNSETGSKKITLLDEKIKLKEAEDNKIKKSLDILRSNLSVIDNKNKSAGYQISIEKSKKHIVIPKNSGSFSSIAIKQNNEYRDKVKKKDQYFGSS